VWPPFVLVAGLLLIGAAAAADGLFEALGARLASDRLPPRVLLVALLGLVACVTAVLNLDTSVVFLTPVLVHAARRRGVDELPFLYGSVFMANSASLLLPGSNLTNLLVLDGAARRPDMVRAWLVACVVTAAFVALVFRFRARAPERTSPPPLRLGVGVLSVVVASVLVLALRDPALPVLAVGLGTTAWRRTRPDLGVRTLSALFAFSVVLGALARTHAAHALLPATAGWWSTAATAAGASLLLNNLPAAVLLSAHPPAHPAALLIGLDLGPNAAVTGSLAAVLWLRVGRALGAEVSIAGYSLLGAALVPLTLVGALSVG
jgi:arsenical pump membrane protein